MERHIRAYRRLLVLYPAQHRRDYGEAMLQLFGDRFRVEGGGAGSFLLWFQIVIDLVKTAFTERLETTMRSFRTDWWRIVAVPLSLVLVYAGVGNLITDTEGALFGRVAYVVVSVLGLGLVIAGLLIRKKNRMVGSTMIAVGVMPGLPLIIMFWFPPALAIGILSAAVSLTAFIDAPKAQEPMVELSG